MKSRTPWSPLGRFPNVALLFAVLVAVLGPSAAQAASLVEDGRADLRASSDLIASGLRLDGDWQFAPGVLLDGSAPDDAFETTLVVPGYWDACVSDGAGPDGQGIGTYRVRLQVPGNARNLAVRIATLGTAWVLYAGETRIASAGRLPVDGRAPVPDYEAAVAEVPDDHGGTVVLTLAVANADHASGGAWDLIWFGDEDALRQQQAQRTRLAMLLAGAYGILGLYHLMLWLTRRREAAAGAFAVACGAIMVRVLCVDDVQLQQMFPGLSWSTGVRIDYLTLPTLLLATVSQVRLLFPEEVPRIMAWGLGVSAGAFVPIILFTPTSFFTGLLPGMQAVILVTTIFGPLWLLRAMLAGREGASLFLAGIGALAVAAAHDAILWLFPALPSLEILGGRLDLQPVGFLVFIGCQASALAMRSSTTVTELEHTSLDLAETRDAIDAYARQLEQRVAERTEELQALNAELALRARSDGLTGIGNRRYFDEQLLATWQDHLRRGAELALIMVDADRFKNFNDARGHVEGDAALRAIAGVLDDNAERPRDFVARYGGEELAVILPDTDEEGARYVAETMRAQVEALGIEHPGSEHGVVTISAGVAAIVPSASHSPEDLVSLADAALYLAKNSGRNRVGTDTQAMVARRGQS